MPGHTTLWNPEQYIKALRHQSTLFLSQGMFMSADECEGAARMMWKLWCVAEPDEAEKARHRLVSVLPTVGKETTQQQEKP